MNHSIAHNEYRDLIERLCGALAAGRGADIAEHVWERGAAEGIAEHLANAFGERIELLRRALRLVALAFDDFDSLIFEYMRQVPIATYHSGRSDAERFLDWLSRSRSLTPKQQDFAAYRRAELTVERLARRRRAAHQQFQRLLAAMAGRATWQAVPGAADVSLPRTAEAWTIHLNPVRVWTRLSIFAAETESGGAPVLFYPVGAGIEAGRLDELQRRMLGDLEAVAPVEMRDWQGRHRHRSAAEQQTVLGTLVAQGLVALERCGSGPEGEQSSINGSNVLCVSGERGGNSPDASVWRQPLRSGR